MTKLRAEDLPADMQRLLRKQLEAVDRRRQEREGVPVAARSRPAYPGEHTPSPLYRCMACDFTALWTTSKDATPAAWRKHTAETGHGHFRCVL